MPLFRFPSRLTVTECLLALAVTLAIVSLFVMTVDGELGALLFLNGAAVFLNVLDRVSHVEGADWLHPIETLKLLKEDPSSQSDDMPS